MAEYIEREAINRICFMDYFLVDGEVRTESVALVRDIEKLPAADVAPVVHGQWIEDHDYLKCPECGVMVKWDFTFFDIGNWNYCPNCGADMRGSNDE